MGRSTIPSVNNASLSNTSLVMIVSGRREGEGVVLEGRFWEVRLGEFRLEEL